MPSKQIAMLNLIGSKKQLPQGGLAALVTIALASMSLTGCTLCCPPYMDDYATVGGKWARANPTDGTVGSAFSDPGVMHASHDAVIDSDFAFDPPAGNGEFIPSGSVIEGDSQMPPAAIEPSETILPLETTLPSEPESIIFLE